MVYSSSTSYPVCQLPSDVNNAMPPSPPLFDDVNYSTHEARHGWEVPARPLPINVPDEEIVPVQSYSARCEPQANANDDYSCFPAFSQSYPPPHAAQNYMDQCLQIRQNKPNRKKLPKTRKQIGKLQHSRRVHHSSGYSALYSMAKSEDLAKDFSERLQLTPIPLPIRADVPFEISLHTNVQTQNTPHSQYYMNRTPQEPLETPDDRNASTVVVRIKGDQRTAREKNLPWPCNINSEESNLLTDTATVTRADNKDSCVTQIAIGDSRSRVLNSNGNYTDDQTQSQNMATLEFTEAPRETLASAYHANNMRKRSYSNRFYV